MQIVPKGKKWTSAFGACGGGYLASNHIALLGLTRFQPDMCPENISTLPNDWTAAVNIRFQRSKETLDNLLSCGRHGMLAQS